ncbi:MAG: type II toxin-antitoxin system VapC family toxin [Solirubrobacterales bacterium]|nr:type II toxin-antitoxin system VapC family toxin [Solirubrobacterales bacterium]
MLVVDTSAILEALAAKSPAPGLVERLAGDGDLHAPHLIDVELLHALRAMTIRREITSERAADARSDFAELGMVRYPHEPLSDRIWALRHNMSAYDAAFVALAETLGTPLLTCDARVATAPGHHAKVELFTDATATRPAGAAKTPEDPPPTTQPGV